MKLATVRDLSNSARTVVGSTCWGRRYKFARAPYCRREVTAPGSGVPFEIPGVVRPATGASLEPAEQVRQNVAMIFDADLDGIQRQARRFLASKECVLISAEIRIKVLKLRRPLRRKGPLEATAAGPADAVLVKGADIAGACVIELDLRPAKTAR